MQIDLDQIDKEILRQLQVDAHATNKQIAEKLGLTTTPIYERIKNLEKKGIIKQYVAVLDKNKIGKSLTAYCSVSLRHHTKENVDTFEEKIQVFSEVQECYHIAGGFDFLLKISVTNMPAYHNFIKNKLSTLENIGSVNSSFVLNEIKYSVAYELD